MKRQEIIRDSVMDFPQRIIRVRIGKDKYILGFKRKWFRKVLMGRRNFVITRMHYLAGRIEKVYYPVEEESELFIG